MIPLLSQFLKQEMQQFFRMLSWGRNKVRDIVFEEEWVSIPTTVFDSVRASIPIIVQEADMKSH